MSGPPPSSGWSEAFYRGLVGRPVATVMAFLAALVFGLVSYTNLPLNLMPDLSYPTLTVRTEFPGAAPGEVEKQVARPLEESLSTVPGLVSLESISRAGIADVILEFEWGASMGEVSQAVRERLGLIGLPDEAKRPLVLRYDPNLDPILRLALAAPPGDDPETALMEVRRIADEEVRRALETLPGVAAVKVRGGLEREVLVQVDEGLLHARGFTIDDVVGRLQAENVNLAGGSLLEGQTEYLIRTLNEFRGPEEIRDLVLVKGETIARLGEFATITVVPKERDVVGRVGGREAVEIAVYREADANIVNVSRGVKNKVFGTAAQQAWVKEQAKKKAEAAKAGEGAQGALAEGEEAAARGDRGKGKGDQAGKGKGDQAGKGKGDKAGEGKGKGDKAAKGARGKGKGARAGKGDGKGGRGKGGRGGRGGEKMLERAMSSFLANQLPRGMEFQLVADQATFIEASVADVFNTAITGAFFAVLVLMVFLRRAFATTVISVAIPLSVAVTYAPMYLGGVSLNLMSLGGLALAIGMLVDNSIVVLESITRCQEEGDDPLRASVRGTVEVAGAVFASTLTTVAVFFPIAFVTGVAGQLFGHLALTVVFGLLASLAVALFLIPVAMASWARFWTDHAVADGWTAVNPLQPWLAFARDLGGWWRWSWSGSLVVRALKVSTGPAVLAWQLLVLALVAPAVLVAWLFARAVWLLLVVGTSLAGLPRRVGARLPVQAGLDGGLEALDNAYSSALRGSVARPSLVLLPAAALFGASVLLAPRLGTELLPEVHQGVVLARVALPVGTPLSRTLEVVDALERRVGRLPQVASLYSASGAERDATSSSDQGEHTADLTVQLKEHGRPIEQEAAFAEAFRGVVAELPGVTAELSAPALFSFRTPLEVEVRGAELGELRRTADAAVHTVASLGGFTDVRSNLQSGYPEVQIRYDRERLTRYDLDLGSVARMVRDKVAGNVATDLRGRGRRTEVRVVLRERDRSSIDDLRRLNVNPRGTPPIALESVADLTLAEGPSEIRRSQQERAALVTANLVGFDLGSAAARVAESLAPLETDTVRLDVGGQSREMEASLQSLGFALLLAVFLVYVIMASQFESIVQPFIILFALPLAGVGVLGGLALSGTPVSVVVLIGSIVLAGVVVNNAIVLVDYANQLRARGLSAQAAIVEAGRVRLRPILISTLTTVLGLVPMALGTGDGSEIRQPLALTIIAGLSSSTLLTLGVIPVLYATVARVGLIVDGEEA